MSSEVKTIATSLFQFVESEPNNNMNINFDKSFNWLAVLKDLRAGMPLTREEHQRLTFKSAQWPTCACGQLCKALPRTSYGAPEDCELTELGHSFHLCIKIECWSLATVIFHQIEARTTLLLELPNEVVGHATDHDHQT